MASTTITINGKIYELARADLLPSGAKRWQIGGEPAQPSPGVALQFMEWELSGPHFNSFERIAPGASVGYLGTDYTDNIDTRVAGKLTLGPFLQTVDLSGTGGTGANTNCWTRSYDMNATEFLYIGRGTKYAKVNPSSASWLRAIEASAAMAENITSLLFTRTPGGTREISIGMRATAYRVITAVANDGSNDTHSANASSVINSVMLLGPDRVFGAQDVAAATAATLRGNILTGAVTMASPAWATNATLPGHNAKINSLGLDINFVVVGTTRGPQMLDANYNQFRDLSNEVDNNAFNCAAMGNWQPYGLTYSLPYGTRTQYAGQSVSDGPENFPNNTSPVGLRMTAITGFDRWEYRAYYNEVTDLTYIVAGRPRQSGDPHDNPMSFYCIATMPASVEVKFLGNPGTFDGLNSYPVIIGGYDMDMFFFKATPTAYSSTEAGDYVRDGTWYGTESRRDPHLLKDVVAYEVQTGLEDNFQNRITLGLAVDSAASFTTLTGTLLDGSGGTVNGRITTNGFHRVLPITDAGVPATGFSGRALKPSIRIERALSIDPASLASVTSKLRILYRPRPIISQTLQFSVVLDNGTGPGMSVPEAQAALIAAWGAGPVACENPDDGLTASYIRVDRVDVQEVQDKGNGKDRAASAVRIATVHAFVWPTAAGQ